MIKGCVTHAIIHTQTSMTYVSQMPFGNDSNPYDIRMMAALDAYTYKRPLAIQAHPVTENSKRFCPLALRYVFRLTNAEKDGALFYELAHMLGRHGGYHRMCRFLVSLLAGAVIITITTRGSKKSVERV